MTKLFEIILKSSGYSWLEKQKVVHALFLGDVMTDLKVGIWEVVARDWVNNYCLGGAYYN